MNVQWSVFADRVQETLVLSSRPPDDRLPFTVWQRASYAVADGSGGVVMRGVGGTTAFHVLAATATDTQGHSSTTHLVLGRAPSRIELDPSLNDDGRLSHQHSVDNPLRQRNGGRAVDGATTG